ncbi:MAG TPA: serine hydrolase, partial [Thermoanaerobaculia bacterium]
PVTAGTLYDLASLTKVVATTTMAMILVDEGKLDLDRPVRDFLPGFQGPGKEAVTVRHLLTHSSGLAAVAPLFQEIRGRAAYLERIQAMDLVYPAGSRSTYSDLGIILLGEILERVAGQPLEAFVRERVLDPLGMRDTRFRPPARLRPRIAPTEHDTWRGRLVHGEVHDENAFALGGVAPHAGLFGTAPDLARFAQMLLNGGVLHGRRIVSRETVERFTRRAGIPGSDRALGWDTRSAEGSSAGTLFSLRSFGHTGFTGTSIWIDPERRLYVILLTNRVHPTRENVLIREVRPAVADAVVRALTPGPSPASGRGEQSMSASPPVRVGLERIAAGETKALEGKRLGLIVHGASVTAEGRHAVEVLRERRLNVVWLFSPEHGLRGQAAAGEGVESNRDEVSGLPVVSLYGERRKPRPEDLEELDALVFDLQDAGVRFYTYVSTLILALESAAEAGLDFVVLDRPNPLGGERIEGPVSAPRDVVPASFLNLAPGPLVHGMTLGEMARYVNARLERPARLTVVPLEGWKRRMTWAGTGRPWNPPSPNLRSAEAALAYPGTALLEATNLSEGRGTESPFLLLGSPWLDPSGVVVSVPGFHLEPARFTPRASPAVLHPKYPDQECRGFRLKVIDPAMAQPYRLGITLLVAFSRQPGFEWRDGGGALTRLVGTPRLVEDLKAGKTVEEILAADTADHAAWRRDRRPALLYP